MLLFPNCKINIGLDILRRRPDGYHDIETVMYPVYGLCDGLEIIRTGESGAVFSSSGLELDCSPGNNLVMKTFRLMQDRYGIDGVKIHLHKVIPSGAGLGGGSADAAFTVTGLNSLFKLGLSLEKMELAAAEMGSDVPFFIRNIPQLCTGRGEIMSPAGVNLEGKHLLILKPDIHIPTVEAYMGVAPEIHEENLASKAGMPLEKWKGVIENGFEKTLFTKYPQLGLLKKSLYESGAIYASLTGSGSAVYGIFDKPPICMSEIYKNAFLTRL